MPDRDLVSAKLESLRRCLDRIRSHTPADAQALVMDCDAQDIVSVHEYQEVDWNRVYRIIAEDLGDFREFAGAVRAAFPA